MATCEKKGSFNITITNKNGWVKPRVKTYICAIGRVAYVAIASVGVSCAFRFLTTRILRREPRKTVVRFFRFRPNFRAFKRRKPHKTPRNACYVGYRIILKEKIPQQKIATVTYYSVQPVAATNTKIKKRKFC